ncbi:MULTISPECIES: LacI family DNA-binding transcriptional regulator [Paenibacillus]|uniref:LacI family DNA-binding transcriptional regulator n=1 Tax=Paenibacillus TaxID=44249 RepID=UPI0011A693F8|nr:LacI family DNA-binding transcriptional regulator [Paenibacillus sp. IHBB 10380]
MATMKDVAKAAGVSLSTASYAINGSSKISEATRAKVIEAAKQLNYQKNGLATDLKRSSTKTIALILSDMSGPYYSELIRGVQEVALENGYDLIACSSFGGNESTAIKFLREKRVDGVIISEHNLHDEAILQSARKGFPIVVLDRYLKGDYIYNVLVDNEKGGYMATELLIKNGCKQIAYISSSSNSYDHKLRYKGYLQALSDYNLECTSNLNINGRFTIDGGYMATKLLIGQRQLPDAIFYANDEMAAGGIKAFQEAGIRVPDDISIVGFDDIFLAEHMNPPLTTIRQPKYEIGSLAAHLIVQLLEGLELEHEYVLSTELVVRRSCKLRY